MAVPAHNTGAIAAHLNEDVHPRDLPSLYTVQVLGDKMIPKMVGGSWQNFSTTIEPKRGDIVALWFTKDAMKLRGYRFVVLRLISIDDHLVVAHTLSPANEFRFHRDQFAAIHVWIGKGPIFGVMGDDPKPAPPAPAVATNNVPATQPGLSIFKNEKFSVRGGIDENGEPWFVAKDVAVALGYTDHTNAIKQHCRGVAKHHPITDALGRKQEVRIIHEPDVYRLIFKSQLDTAQEFEDWVVSEVLPSIRKTGGYSVQPKQEEAPQFPIPQTFAEALMLAANQAAQIEHQKTRIVEKNAQIADMREDVDALDRIAKAEGSLCITDAAKTIQIDPKKLFAFLRQNGWIYRRAGSTRDVAYQAKIVAGLLEHKTTTVHRTDGSEKVATQALVTPKGLARLAKLFPPAAEVA